MGVFENAESGRAVFDTVEQASGFASAIEEGFLVDDPEPYTCPLHDDEKGWRVEYHVRSEEMEVL